MEGKNKRKELSSQYESIDPIKFISKYNHLRSIKNFIDHFDELPKGIQDEAFDLISSAINYIRHNDVSDGIEAKEYFVQFIAPIGVIFKDNCGFSVIFRFETFLFFLALILTILFVINASIAFISSVIVFFGVIIFRNWYYIFKGRCYSINW